MEEEGKGSQGHIAFWWHCREEDSGLYGPETRGPFIVPSLWPLYGPPASLSCLPSSMVSCVAPSPALPFRHSQVPLGPPCHWHFCSQAFWENQLINLKLSNEPVKYHRSLVPISLIYLCCCDVWINLSASGLWKAWSHGSPRKPARSVTLLLIYNLADTTRCFCICLKCMSVGTKDEVFGS